MNNGNHTTEPQDQSRDARLPQIDPLTFAALNTLDSFVGKAPLTRQEHADANKSLQHIVQTVEILQATVKELTQKVNGAAKKDEPLKNGGFSGVVPSDSSTVVAEVAEEMFKKAR